MANPSYNLYKNFFKKSKPKNLLDIGANSGQFVKMWKSIFPECQTLSIEANPYSANKLKKLNLPYLNIGISKEKGRLTLTSNKKKPASKGASFYKELNYNKFCEEDLLKIEVDVDTLDNLFNSPFDVIKIDVQGSELDVILGGKNTLLQAKYIIIEVSILPYNQNAPLADKVIELLESYNIFIEDIIEEHIIDNKIAQLDIIFKKRNGHNYQVLNTKSYKKKLGL